MYLCTLLIENDMTQCEYIHEGEFEFEAGGSVRGLKVVYHRSEREWQKDDGRKVIWICHALTANSDAEDWWPELVGPGKLFDTEKYFVVCANMLGSAYGSSGPSSIDPETGRPCTLHAERGGPHGLRLITSP